MRSRDKHPRVPGVALRVWQAFWQIEQRGRAGNGFAAMPVANQEIDAWCRLRGERFAPWELDLLDRMERARLSFLNDDSKRAPPAEPMTAQSFLSMFDRK